MSECKYCQDQRKPEFMPNMIGGYCLWCVIDSYRRKRIIIDEYRSLIEKENSELKDKLKKFEGMTFWDNSKATAKLQAENIMLKLELKHKTESFNSADKCAHEREQSILELKKDNEALKSNLEKVHNACPECYETEAFLCDKNKCSRCGYTRTRFAEWEQNK